MPIIFGPFFPLSCLFCHGLLHGPRRRDEDDSPQDSTNVILRVIVSRCMPPLSLTRNVALCHATAAMHQIAYKKTWSHSLCTLSDYLEIPVDVMTDVRSRQSRTKASSVFVDTEALPTNALFVPQRAGHPPIRRDVRPLPGAQDLLESCAPLRCWIPPPFPLTFPPARANPPGMPLADGPPLGACGLPRARDPEGGTERGERGEEEKEERGSRGRDRGGEGGERERERERERKRRTEEYRHSC